MAFLVRVSILICHDADAVKMNIGQDKKIENKIRCMH